MASNQNPSLFQCTSCHEALNLESVTLPCLHSLCGLCLYRHFEGEESGNSWCPECHEPMNIDQLSLSPILVKTFKHRQLESAVWHCNLCLEDGIESTARNWCYDCQKLHCANCGRVHEKLKKEFQHKHNMRDLDEMGRDERDKVVEELLMDVCSLHKKAKDFYCNDCNLCLCETCSKTHSADFDRCWPFSVRKEALKQKSLGPTLAEEMYDLEMDLRRLNEDTRIYTEKLNSDCDLKCRLLWEDLEAMMANARQKTDELCGEIKRTTAEQVERWHNLLEENENILKRLEIWRMNLHHLLTESEDMDVVRGFESLRSKLSSQLRKSIQPDVEFLLEVKFQRWWMQVLQQLKKNKKIGSVSLTEEKLFDAQNLVFEKQFNLPGSRFSVSAIHVCEDDHIFICKHSDYSIMEFNEQGEYVCECNLRNITTLINNMEVDAQPLDMCFISPDIFLVTCSVYYNLVLVERKKNPPFLQVKYAIPTNRKFRSLCKINKWILASDMFFQVDFLSKTGREITTLKAPDSDGYAFPRIRANPVNKNFWWTDKNIPEIFCYDLYGNKIKSIETKEKISDFYVNDFGHLYFSNKKGIFTFPTENNLYKFEKSSEDDSQIFIRNNKMFVAVWIDGKWLIKIFKMS